MAELHRKEPMGEGVAKPHRRKLWGRVWLSFTGGNYGEGIWLSFTRENHEGWVWPSLTRGNHGGVVWTSLTGGNHEGGGCGRASQEETMKPWGRV